MQLSIWTETVLHTARSGPWIRAAYWGPVFSAAFITILTVVKFPAAVMLFQFPATVETMADAHRIYLFIVPFKFKPLKTQFVHKPAAPVFFFISCLIMTFYYRIATLTAKINAEFNRQYKIKFKPEMFFKGPLFQYIAAPMFFFEMFKFFPPFQGCCVYCFVIFHSSLTCFEQALRSFLS